MNQAALERPMLRCLMKECWDERLQLDYRIWMNDFAETDEQLWQTGQRDLKLLLAGLEPEDLACRRAVDLGCGVGRLLRAAAPLVKEILAIDVSSEAIALARRFTSLYPNVSYIHGNGTDLTPIDDVSVDLVFSFGVLAHLPVVVCASYLIEMSRILRIGAAARLQIFVGRCAPFTQTDIFAYRSYQMNQLHKVFSVLGLELIALRDVPLKANFVEDGWLWPTICDLTKVECVALPTADELSEVLYPEGEPIGETSSGSRTSYIIAVRAAVQYIQWGRLQEARHVLSFAVRSYRDAETSIVNLLRVLERKRSK